MVLIVDSHEDIAYNVLNFSRDYLRAASETRALEKDSGIPAINGESLIGWPDYQRGKIAIVFGTLFIVPQAYHTGQWGNMTYRNPSEAASLHQAQVDVYHRLADENPEKFKLIINKSELDAIVAEWENKPISYPDLTNPVGIIMTMEGAEGIGSLDELHKWWELGVRIIGPVWAGGRFCGGTRQNGSFTSEGYKLLEMMAELGFVLDMSHMSEVSVLQAVDRYEGEMIASHANAKALLKNVPHQRHLTDTAIKRIAERSGVIGVIPYNNFLKSDWSPADNRKDITLEHLVDHIDHICQLTGSIEHAGIGSDFEGGFGFPDVPYEIDTISDLQKIALVLQKRGYCPDDIKQIMGYNWIKKMRSALPQ